jgi:hypothetical protein
MPLFIASLCASGTALTVDIPPEPEQPVVLDPLNLNLVTDFEDNPILWNEYQETIPDTICNLFIPAGTHDCRGPDNVGARGRFSKAFGPALVTVFGAGMDLTSMDQITVPFNKSPYYDADSGGNENGPQPKIQTMLAGESVATLVTLSDVSEFSVGQYVLLMAFDLQGYGYPQNNHFFEYRLITAIDLETGELTFDAPVRDDYKSTYPRYNGGSGSQPDQAGPATLFPMNIDKWDCDTLVRDLTVNPTYTGPYYSEQRHIKWQDVRFGKYAHIPSISHTVEYIDCVFAGQSGFEFDKSVELVNFEGCTIEGVGPIMTLQSSSIYELTMTDCALRTFTGTAKVTTMDNCTFTEGLTLGCTAYGGSYSAELNDVSCATLAVARRQINTNGVDSKGAEWTWIGGADGQFSYPRASIGDSQLYAIVDPKIWYHFVHATYGRWGPPFQLTDASYDSGTGLVTFSSTLTGSEPGITTSTQATKATLSQGLTVTGIDADDATNPLGCYCHPDADGRPIGEYFNFGDWPATAEYYLAPFSVPRLRGVRTTVSTAQMHGRINSLTFTVTQAYTGTNPTCRMSITGDFSGGWWVCDEDLTTFHQWRPEFDLTQTGTRVITPGGVTGTAGSDSGLSLGLGRWFCSNHAAIGGAALSYNPGTEDPSVQPQFTFVLDLDQEITPA